MFYLIHEIVLVERKQLFFFCQNLQDVKYNDNILGHNFGSTNLGLISLLTNVQLIEPSIYSTRTGRGKHILRSKKYYWCI